MVIYRNGRRVKPENYTLFKQGKVQFNDCEKVVQGQVFFEYDRNVKHYKPYSNDLSCDVSEFQDVHNGAEGMMYSFVPDPTGEKRNVLMINCKSLLKEASNMRQQFYAKAVTALRMQTITSMGRMVEIGLRVSALIMKIRMEPAVRFPVRLPLIWRRTVN